MAYPPITWQVYCLWAIALAMLTGYYLLLRRLPLRAVEPVVEPSGLPGSIRFKLEPLDYLSLGILVLLAGILGFAYRTLPPFPPDSIYHVLVAQHILDKGAVPFWNDWEYAPIGRPHLYPPLYHLMLAGCAMLYKGDVLSAYQTVQPLMLPFSYFCTWLLARWLFGVRHAFFALLLVGSDMQFAIMGGMAAPSLLAGGFVSLMVLFFLSGHLLLAILLGILAAYAHLSILPMAFAGLAAFCLWQRVFRFRLLILLSAVILTALPWITWLWVNHSGFKHPMDVLQPTWSPIARFAMKITWLQMINLGILMMTGFAMRRSNWRDPRNRLMLVFLIAFIPMLLSYGGRYFTQTLAFWCILAAGYLAAWDWRPQTLRRKILIGLMPLLPSVILVGTYIGIPIGPIPMLSAWLVPPALTSGLVQSLLDGDSLYAFKDCVRAGNYIQANSSPDMILFIQETGPEATLKLFPLAFYAHRKTDMGVWEETAPSPELMTSIKSYARDYRGDACYVAFTREQLPSDTTQVQFGKFWVGIRHHKP